uniref:C2 domain-containing protein n=1 Tax=Nothobranchius furzeri TaxID=105023 RepID=A0A8C6MBH9_NOTFU
MYRLEIELKRGHDLAIRDRGGTSDPYVKFKLGGKEVFRSKTIHKNLNPVWDEKITLIVESLSEPLYVKVFDYDFGLQDDFMGSAFIYLESLEQQRFVRCFWYLVGGLLAIGVILTGDAGDMSPAKFIIGSCVPPPTFKKAC